VAPPISNTIRTVCAISSISEATELRWLVCTDTPFFGGGDFSVYQRLYRPLRTPAEVQRYLEAYFRQMSRRAKGQLMAVNGYYQLYHTALRLGAKNVMVEVGNQVPLTALQIACVRGAARQRPEPARVTRPSRPSAATVMAMFCNWTGTRSKGALCRNPSTRCRESKRCLLPLRLPTFLGRLTAVLRQTAREYSTPGTGCQEFSARVRFDPQRTTPYNPA